MFIYQTKKRELYYERVIALYQQTGYGKKQALEIPENSLPLSIVQGSPSGLRPSVNP
jgi:hypothetical protein